MYEITQEYTLQRIDNSPVRAFHFGILTFACHYFILIKLLAFRRQNCFWNVCKIINFLESNEK